MENFKTFFEKLVERADLTAAQISKKSRANNTPVTDASLSYALRGEKTLSPETVEAIAPILKLTENEILKLNMLSLAAKTKNYSAQDRMVRYAATLEESNKLTPISPPVKSEVSVWGEIRAGSTELSENNASVVGVTGLTDQEIKNGYFCMKISGDSMEDEKIFDGDIGVFSPSNNQNINDREIYAVEVESFPVWMIKKICRLPSGKIGLLSANKKHKLIEIDQRELSIAVKGRLIRTVRERGKNFNL